MAQIRTLKDNDKNIVYPQSVTQAIVDANGDSLDAILHNVVMTASEEDVADVIVGYEDINNKVIEITEESTDVQYPSAKAVINYTADNYYNKIETDEKYAKKSIYNDTIISTGRKSGTAIGSYSTALGYNTTASGAFGSYAEGASTTASGNQSHAEGLWTEATAMSSHAEGRYTIASGSGSHTEGFFTIAASDNQHAQGEYNIEDTTNTYAHIVGNGNSDARSNAHTLDWNGNAWFSGDIYVGSNSGTNKDEGSKRLARVDEIPTITAQTTDLEAGVTPLATGNIVFVYEE